MQIKIILGVVVAPNMNQSFFFFFFLYCTTSDLNCNTDQSWEDAGVHLCAVVRFRRDDGVQPTLDMGKLSYNQFDIKQFYDHYLHFVLIKLQLDQYASRWLCRKVPKFAGHNMYLSSRLLDSSNPMKMEQLQAGLCIRGDFNWKFGIYLIADIIV